MGNVSRRGLTAALASVAASGLAVALCWPAAGAPNRAVTAAGHVTGVGNAGDESSDLMSSLSAFGDPRLSPAGSVQPGAYGAAGNHIVAMPVRSATFTEVTTQPFNADSLHFRDRAASNSGGGAGYSAGRIAALAVDRTIPA